MSLGDLLGNYAQTVGVNAAIKTNLGPEIVIYNSDVPSKRSALADLLKLGIVVRDRNGKTLASYGGYPKTNPIIAGGLLLAAGGLLYVMGRGLVR